MFVLLGHCVAGCVSLDSVTIQGAGKSASIFYYIKKKGEKGEVKLYESGTCFTIF